MFVLAVQTEIFDTGYCWMVHLSFLTSHNLLFFRFCKTSTKNNIFGFSVVFSRKIAQISIFKVEYLENGSADLNDFGPILQDFERPFGWNQLVLALQFSFKHGLIDEQGINNIAGLLTCRYIRPCIFLDFVCDRPCFFVYTVVEWKVISPKRTCDVKTMCYIVFMTHSLHWRYIKTALQEYVIIPITYNIHQFLFTLLSQNKWQNKECYNKK